MPWMAWATIYNSLLAAAILTICSTVVKGELRKNIVRNHVKLGVSLRVLYCVVDTGYGLGRSLGGLQTGIAERLEVPNG